MADCSDGTGSYVGFTVVTDAFCRNAAAAGNKVAETQAFIRKHDVLRTDATAGVHGLVRFRSLGEYDSVIESFDAANVDDGCGAVDRMRKGCSRTNPGWSGVTEYNGEYPIEALIGAEGTIRRWNPAGTYREAYGWCAGALIFPNQAVKVEALGRMDFQWEGGASGDRGFPRFHGVNGAQQFPA